MSVSEACTLVPTIRLLDHDPQEDLDALCELAQQAWAYSPMVGIEPLDEYLWAGRTLHQPQSLLIETTGLSHFFGGEGAMMNHILAWLHQQGYFAVAAMASNLGAAWALANYSCRSQVADKLLDYWLARSNRDQDVDSSNIGEASRSEPIQSNSQVTSLVQKQILRLELRLKLLLPNKWQFQFPFN